MNTRQKKNVEIKIIILEVQAGQVSKKNIHMRTQERRDNIPGIIQVTQKCRVETSEEKRSQRDPN